MVYVVWCVCVCARVSMCFYGQAGLRGDAEGPSMSSPSSGVDGI